LRPLSRGATASPWCRTVAFLGWFGPRGRASIGFAVILVEEANLAHESVLLNTIFFTVALSVLLHGLTTTPLATQPGSRLTRATPCPRSKPSRLQTSACTDGRPGKGVLVIHSRV
jgi:sodium/hydrogen antiporter